MRNSFAFVLWLLVMTVPVFAMAQTEINVSSSQPLCRFLPGVQRTEAMPAVLEWPSCMASAVVLTPLQGVALVGAFVITVNPWSCQDAKQGNCKAMWDFVAGGWWVAPDDVEKEFE